MNELSNVKIGFAMTGSFCTFEKAFLQAEKLKESGAELIPIMLRQSVQDLARQKKISEGLKIYAEEK